MCSYGKKHTVPAVRDYSLPPEADRDVKVIPSVMSIIDRVGLAGLRNLLKGEKMNRNIEKAVTGYQCCGCVKGPAMTCYIKSDYGDGCGAHCPGTIAGGIGTVMLGIDTKGFNRVGPLKGFLPQIFEKYSELQYDMYNVPIWKHLNEEGHTLVRGLAPRLNQPFLHIYLEDCRDRISCVEITKDQVAAMD